MTTRGERDNAYIAALSSYRSSDPISLRLLVDAVEGRARRMRAQAMRELVNAAVCEVCRSVAAVGTAFQGFARRQGLPAAGVVKS